MFTKFINLSIFAASFFIGLIFVWMSAPNSTTVFVYPTPENVKDCGYRDKANNCFEYKMKETECPDDETKIKTIPVQMGDTLPALPLKQVEIGDKKINKI